MRLESSFTCKKLLNETMMKEIEAVVLKKTKFEYH